MQVENEGQVPQEYRDRWEHQVLERYRRCCVNCGSPERVRPRLVVPMEAGGKMVEDNSTLLCRGCEMAMEAAASPYGASERIVNVLVSNELHDKLTRLLTKSNGFGSTSALVRYLISKYNQDAGRFDDLELYQDYGSDVKMNVWVDRAKYARFKDLVAERGLTVTTALKGLLTMFDAAQKI